MRLEKLTIKAQEAVQAAQSLADQSNHQAIEPEHLLLALLQQQEGIVGPLLAKLGSRPEAITRQIEAEIGKLPKDPRLGDAAKLLDGLVFPEEFLEFLTLPAYRLLE